MPSIACLNGVFRSPEETYIPIEDRGYIFGDSVYETLRCYKGRIWSFDRHMVRFSRSLVAVGFPMEALDSIRKWAPEAVEKSGIKESVVYIQVSRGVAPRHHTYDPKMAPNILVTVRPLDPPSQDVRKNGVTAITIEDMRWSRRDIKTTNLLPNILAKQSAHNHGAWEAILVEPSGRVTEGSSTNLFAVFDGEVWTAPADHHILGGITRDLILDFAPRLGLKTHEEIYTVERLRLADELFITGSLTEVLGIVKVDGKPIGTGKVGAITRKVFAEYDRIVRENHDGAQ